MRVHHLPLRAPSLSPRAPLVFRDTDDTHLVDNGAKVDTSTLLTSVPTFSQAARVEVLEPLGQAVDEAAASVAALEAKGK